MMNKKFLGLACAAALGLAAAPASAAFVASWDYNVTLEWVTSGDDAPVFGGGTSATGLEQIESNLLSWGDPNDAVQWDPANQDTWGDPGRSGLGINVGAVNSSIDPDDGVDPVVTNGAPVPTTQLTHYNNAISTAYDTLQSATLLTTLTLTPIPDDVGPEVGPVEVAFVINFVETLNQAPCGFDGATICDDIFIIEIEQLSGSFDYVDGFTYTATISATGLQTPLPDAVCAAAGVPNGCAGFTTPEAQSTPVAFSFFVTAAPTVVPEPATVAMLGLGLLGLGAATATRRRRRDQK